MRDVVTSSPATPSRHRRFDALGFALAVFLLSAIAAVAVPWGKRRQIETRAHAVAADLRAAAAAFQAYARERGDWPPADAAPGKVPSAMAARLSSTNWTQPTPLGGHYLWKLGSVHRGRRYTAAIVLAPNATQPFRLGRDELFAIDTLLDDGNLFAGNFQLGYRHCPLFVLEH